jgi:hypothetical protein
MNPVPKIIAVADLRPGDFLLHCSADPSFVGRCIRAACKSAYTHASIYLGDGLIAEAVACGVQRVKLSRSLPKKGHVAVFRTTNFLKEDAKALNDFIMQLLRARTPYKWWALLKFLPRSEQHFATIREKLDQHFQTKPKRRWFIKRQRISAQAWCLPATSRSGRSVTMRRFGLTRTSSHPSIWWDAKSAYSSGT